MVDQPALGRRIEPAIAGLIDVEIDDIADAGNEAAGDADQIADDDDPVIVIADAAGEGETGQHGGKTAGEEVAPDRAADIAPAFAGDAGARPDDRANIAKSEAIAKRRIGFRDHAGRQPPDDLGGDRVFAVTVGNEEQPLRATDLSQDHDARRR